MRPIPPLATLALVALAAFATATLDPTAALAKDAKAAKNAKDAKPAAKADDEKPFDTVAEGYERLSGLFALHRKAEEHKVLLEIQPSQLEQTFLFAGSVDQSAGERGFYASQQLADFAVTFRRVGKTIQWVQKNTSFTAQAGTPAARAVARSFPEAILGSAKILAKPHPERGSLLVDATELFAARDLPGFAAGLSRAYAPSTFTFDKDRSGVREAKAFPENVLLRAVLHYTADQQRSTPVTLADGRSVPITVAWSLAAVPATAYRPRAADDRVGHFLVVHQDFTSDQAQTPYRRWVTRWNLEKQDPSAAVSPPKQPIVFWLENTIPVEYRDAIREGTLLWNQAFEKAGFKDAVVVKQQPDDADWDAADVRYNVIRWFAGVDATFAIGPSRANPFTGEIYDADIGISEGIIRNARRLAEEYVAPTFTAHEGAIEPAATAWGKDPRHLCAYASGLAEQAAFATALLDARGGLSPELEERLVREYLVELTAHEVGHTLGLRHNFRASALQPHAKLYAAAGETPEASQSSSVMDYNPVLVAAKGAKQGAFVPLTLGPYDYWAIEYAYKPFPEAEEAAGLAAIASRCADPALGYSTDEDAIGTYSPLSIDPLANQYDQATDPLEYFRGRMTLVNELWTSAESRLAQPGEGWQILRRAVGRGMADSYRSLMTSSKFIGGVHHRRDHVGDPNGRPPYEPVAAAKQKEALDLLSEHCFGPKAFRVSPALMNRLAAERIYGLDPSYWNIQRLDYPWHDVVLNIQRSVLARLLHPITLGRVLDNELRFAASEKFRMSDLFAGLNASIWSELDAPAGEITSLRRNLQREHLKQLSAITLREPFPAPSQPGAIGTPPHPEDATTLSRWALSRLQTKIRARLAAEGGMDVTTRAHLQDSQARIAAVLAAQVERPD